ncbi:DUF4124 domain-containing protein [Pelotalea chapellei]|uniref:DUF4124 domain-containing protein n=1 Tax=Pelotalea chapellei TaxID=44671 RepID=A0ABS5U4K0_9BACT|nr:DUF4124 domain-containing protein [Pelotalea chapellei]MBT1070585.1 DUF4124 domain-containing protein [Pelotalea chapellei]
MGRALLVPLLLICHAAAAGAFTYQWTNEKGVTGFTDSIDKVPSKYRDRVRRREDITIRNPRIQQELKEQERRLRLEEQSAPGGRLPDEIPAQAPRSVPQPSLEQPKNGQPAGETLPPGRTKSQRIRDNIERRGLE